MTPNRMVLIASLCLAASPALATKKPLHGHHHAKAQREVASNQIHPLMPPARAPVADPNAAPVPNENVTSPIDTSDQAASVAPAVMQIHYPPQGDGYVIGSSAQAMDDREAAKVTGVLMHIPLSQ
jgi:hypothetical protein